MREVVANITKRDPDLARQMRRALASIPLNIAEGEGTTYTLEVHESQCNGVSYFDYAKATRTKGQTAPGQVEFFGPNGTPVPHEMPVPPVIPPTKGGRVPTLPQTPAATPVPTPAPAPAEAPPAPSK